MDKRFWAIIGVVVIIFGGIFYFNSKSNQQESAKIDAKPTSHIQGPDDAKVTLTEYGDFQCPVCATYYPIVEQVQEKYADVLKFQFRHLPLTSIHQNALAASRAAEAASNQGKFWDMYNLLYVNQQTWSNGNPGPAFESYAQTIGLNIEQYKKDLTGSDTNAKINADRAEANRLKLTSTPSFFVNDKQIQLSELVDDTAKQPSLAKFSEIIDPVLKSKGVEVPSDEPAEDQPAEGATPDATKPDAQP